MVQNQNPFDILIYLDEGLVKNLASLVLTGYIETTSVTQAFDRMLEAGMQDGKKLEGSNQGSLGKTEREGFRDENELETFNNFRHQHLDRSIDARRSVHEERTVKTTYTTFVLNGNLMDYFNQNNNLSQKQFGDIENGNVEAGEMVKIEGTITNQSLVCYIECLKNIIDIMGDDYLNSLLEEEKKATPGCPKEMNFTIFRKMLTYLESTLTCNNSMDLIMDTGDGHVILTVSKDNFVGSGCHCFDKINCRCVVIGKVLKTCSAADDCSISLLRKTGQEAYYEKFFDKVEYLLECLRKNDFFIPERPDLRYDECAIQVMPINIYV